MDILETLLTAFGGIVILFVIGLTSERGTETVKILLEWMTQRTAKLNSLFTHPIFKLALSALVAWASTKGFDYNFFSAFPMFAGVDPALVPILSAFIVWVTSTYIHPKTKGLLPGAESAVRRLGAA